MKGEDTYMKLLSLLNSMGIERETLLKMRNDAIRSGETIDSFIIPTDFKLWDIPVYFSPMATDLRLMTLPKDKEFEWGNK